VVIDALADIAPELIRHIIGWGFGEIYSRPSLPRRDRQLLNLRMLTALGAEPQLRANIHASLNVGLTPDEIMETFLHASVYCGVSSGGQCASRRQAGVRRTRRVADAAW
jgi:4-carboxymuconolactone decarboxylase